MLRPCRYSTTGPFHDNDTIRSCTREHGDARGAQALAQLSRLSAPNVVEISLARAIGQLHAGGIAESRARSHVVTTNVTRMSKQLEGIRGGGRRQTQRGQAAMNTAGQMDRAGRVKNCMVEPRECLRVGHRAGSLVPDILMRPADSQRHGADEVTPLLIDRHGAPEFVCHAVSALTTFDMFTRCGTESACILRMTLPR